MCCYLSIYSSIHPFYFLNLRDLSGSSSKTSACFLSHFHCSVKINKSSERTQRNPILCGESDVLTAQLCHNITLQCRQRFGYAQLFNLHKHHAAILLMEQQNRNDDKEIFWLEHMDSSILSGPVI